jgi:hypothetical protein
MKTKEIEVRYIGYLSFGALSKISAKNKEGVQIFTKIKPNWFKRFLMSLVCIYWIDEITTKKVSVWENE